eukprot:GHVU01207058.1.p1 GENE.GHVU01207058.1~~GHVU01207058.1.p1  ORF type:complete len:132 (-),score=21.87 GHVU01207058.1:938-1333(-)
MQQHYIESGAFSRDTVLQAPTYRLTFFMHTPTFFMHMHTFFMHTTTFFMHMSTFFMHMPTSFMHMPTFFMHTPTSFMHINTTFTRDPTFKLQTLHTDTHYQQCVALWRQSSTRLQAAQYIYRRRDFSLYFS